MATLIESTELLNGSVSFHVDTARMSVTSTRNGPGRSKSTTSAVRPKLHVHPFRSSRSASNGSMIGSFRSMVDGQHVCEACDTTDVSDESPLVDTTTTIVQSELRESQSNKSTATSNTVPVTDSLNYDDAENDLDASDIKPVWTRTTFVVQNVCCASEVPVIRRLLRPFQCRSVGIAVTTKRVTLVYNSTVIKTETLRSTLTNGGFPARMVSTEVIRDTTTESSNSSMDALHATSPTEPMRKVKASSFVESTISLSSNTGGDRIQDDIVLQRIMKQNFPPSSVRACTISIIVSHHVSYIKIEHNPHCISIHDIMDVIRQSGHSNVALVTDGEKESLFLPDVTSISDGPMEDDDGNGESNRESMIKENNPELIDTNNNNNDDDAIRMELHIILSGLFWAISMLATLAPSQSRWRYLEYTGLLSVLFGLPPVLRKALNTVRRGQFDANCMMSIAAIGACILGEWDEAASVSFLFSVSDYMEARASSRARRALQAIIQLRPDHASIINEVTKEVSIVPATHVPINALLSVRTGDKIAADGIVVEGTSSIDQSSLTGESIPVLVTIGSTVSGGSINIGATQLQIRTTASVQDSAVSRLIRLVEDAQSNRSPTEKLVDTFARSYTPAVVGLAAILATIPWLWGTEIGRTWTLNALILIVIACPCALTISTPVTYAAGLAATAQRGIVCKGGATLEDLGSVHTIILDKTGTITQGKFVVTNLQLIGSSHTRHEMLALMALMEGPSSHPLSTTLLQAVKSEGVAIPTDVSVKEHTLLPGEGVTALIDGQRIYVGNHRLFDRLDMYNDLPIECKQIAQHWEVEQGATVGFIGIDGTGIIGTYSATDVVRLEARDTVQELLSAGFEVLMLTGDGEGAAKAVARQVGIHESAIHSKLLPEDKLRFVTNLKATLSNTLRNEAPSLNIFRQDKKVLFCGDGVNDAPALAFADIGISMGEGAALAMEMSDVTLMDSNLSKLLYVVQMGSRVLRTIRENIIISLLCKLIVIGLTFAGYMTLLLAIASDVGVMLLVTLNGMKLLPRSNEGDVLLEAKHKNNQSRRQRFERVPTDADPTDNTLELV
jgi:Zn2+/Cd2+-exporting ATPase